MKNEKLENRLEAAQKQENKKPTLGRTTVETILQPGTQSSDVRRTQNITKRTADQVEKAIVYEL